MRSFFILTDTKLRGLRAERKIPETVLQEMEWSASRTGLINPVAIFAPVELEGTTVSRASVHNISIVRNLKLGLGDRITVYKANMIIPQIAENLTQSDTLEIPAVCPVCGQPTQIRQVNDVQSLYCNNPDCDAKKIKAFTLFVSRDALNVDGLSESTLEKFWPEDFCMSLRIFLNWTGMSRRSRRWKVSGRNLTVISWKALRRREILRWRG